MAQVLHLGIIETWSGVESNGCVLDGCIVGPGPVGIPKWLRSSPEAFWGSKK